MEPLQKGEPAPHHTGHDSAEAQHEQHVSAHVNTHGKQVVITIDIADHCRHEQPHPQPDPGQEVVYVLTIDGTKHKMSNPNPTGRELLALVGKTPQTHQLNQQQRVAGKPKVTRVKPTDTVDLTTWGIEKFMTLPLDNTEGSTLDNELAPRRQFVLPADDVEYLDGLGLRWEVIAGGPQGCVLVHDVPVPAGYTVPAVCLAVQLEAGYPRSILDMVYVYPALQRTDNQEIGALCPMHLDGKQFQRWSRHRTGANPWRMGIDNLGTHIEQARLWFEQEFVKRPRIDHPQTAPAHAVLS